MTVFIFSVLAVTSLGYLFYSIWRRYRFTQLGRQDNRYDRPGRRWRYFFTNVIAHRKIGEYRFFGLMHFFIMSGFLILLLATPNMVMEGLFDTRIHYLGDNPGFLLVKDIFCGLLIIGVLGAALRRLWRKPAWLKNGAADFIKLSLILIIVLSEVLFHGTRFALGRELNLAAAAPLALLSSQLFTGVDAVSIRQLMSVFWWLHFLAIFAFCFLIPRSSHLHIIFGPFNMYWHTLAHTGSLNSTTVAEGYSPARGANYMEDFTWKQLFDAYSCVKCGRCNGQCPSHQSGEPLKPRALNGRLRKHIDARAPRLLTQKIFPGTSESRPETGTPASLPVKGKKASAGKFKKHLAGGLFEQEFIWSCTTCGACVDICPLSIEHVPKLIDLRRYLVTTTDGINESLRQVFEGLTVQGNPWGCQYTNNPEWAGGLELVDIRQHPGAEYLYYPGCMAVFDRDAQQTAAALIKLLQMAKIDFVIPGSGQWCCGDPARRLGHEELYEQAARRNIAAWQEGGIKKIITSCPHCFNTLKHEYPRYGGSFVVLHHTELLAGLLQTGKLKPRKSVAKTIAFHDPCYLGRYNDIFKSPRAVAAAVPDLRLTEMPRSHNRSFCCGGGGGRLWTTRAVDNPITANRLTEAAGTGAEMIATACPFCKTVFQAAHGSDANRPAVLDIAEILALSV